MKHEKMWEVFQSARNGSEKYLICEAKLNFGQLRFSYLSTFFNLSHPCLVSYMMLSFDTQGS